MQITRFNIRVYGVLINERNDVLLVHEKTGGFACTKFPGGGLELGEGITDCLIREFKEETRLDIEITKHLYTTGFFQQSAFIKTDQLISVYYLVKAKGTNTVRLDEHTVLNNNREETFQFEWVNLKALSPAMLTFPVDKLVCEMIAA